MVFRVLKNKNYTVMSNYHLQDRNLTLKAKGLLSMMLSLPDTWDYSIKGLTKICKEGETSIRTALKELEDYGYLKRNRVHNENGLISDWDYCVYEVPQTLENTEFSPVVENPHVDNQIVENPVQINTKEKNTKKEIDNISKDILQPTPKTSSTLEPKQKKKMNMYDSCISLIEEYTDNKELKEILVEYLKMRLAMKDKPLYGANQFKGILHKLDTIGGNKIEIVNYCIERGYASFYAPTNYGNSNNLKKFGETNQMMTIKKMTKEEKANEFTGTTY